MSTIAELEAKNALLAHQIKDLELQLVKMERSAEEAETRALQAQGTAERTALESHVRAAVIDAGLPQGTVPDILDCARKAGWRIDSTGKPIQERDGHTVMTADRDEIPVSVSSWLQNDLRKQAPYYFGETTGTPASGQASTGPNPWTKDHWNVTDQSKYILKEGMPAAEALAAAAGSSVHATAPAKPKVTIVATSTPVFAHPAK